MRILITGGAGFIGSHLARRCVADGHRVDVLMRPSSDPARLLDLAPRIGIRRLLLSDMAAIRDCLDEVRPTHIFHLASNTGSRHELAIPKARASVGELVDLLALLDAAETATVPPKFFLRTGSIAEYGTTHAPSREGQREQPCTGYAAAIVACTHYAGTMAPRLPFPLVTARLSLVYGAGQDGGFLIPSLVAACLEGRPLELQRPLDRRDLIHVDDAVDALCRLASAPLTGGEIVNVGSGEAIGVRELAELICALADADPALIRARPQDGAVTQRLAVDRLRELTGWAPRISLAEGLAGLLGVGRQMLTAAAA